MALTQISTQGIKDGTITGSDLATNVDLVDNQKLRLGTGNDLQIFHDGSNSYIEEAGTGSLITRTGTFLLRRIDNNNDMFVANGGGSVELYNNGSKKFETTSGGVQVTDNLNMSGGHIFLADNYKLNAGTGDDLQIYHDGSNSYVQDSGTGNLIIAGSAVNILNAAASESMIRATENGAVELYYDNSKKFETTSVGATVTGALVTTSLQVTGGITGTGGNFVLGDSSGTSNNRILLGASQDLQIYHDGGHSYIHQDGTGTLRVLADNFRLNNEADSENIIKADANGAVELYFDNVLKLNTTSNGVTCQDDLAILDNNKITVGTGDDLQIFHDGIGSIIQNNTGPMIIRGSGSNVDIRNSNDEIMIRCNGGAGLDLRHGGTPKLEITSVGISSLDTLISQGEIRPGPDNDHSIGRSNRRYITIFAVNGSINTSDKNEKNTIIDSDLGLDFINKLKPKSYKWNKDDGKTHYGLIAQDLEETLTSLGKTIADFGGIYKEDDSPMGLGYSELIAPLIKAIQELSAEVAALKAS